MIQRINQSEFIRRFEDYGRGDQFSRAGLAALFDYLEQYEDDTGEQIELDVIALCCDYSEHTISELWSDYSHIFQGLSRDDYDSDDELNEAMVDVLRDHTTVIEVDSETFIIQAF